VAYFFGLPCMCVFNAQWTQRSFPLNYKRKHHTVLDAAFLRKKPGV